MSISTDESGAADGTMAMLKLMADPAALAAAIKSYEDAKSAAEATIALLGPANEIISLRETTQQLLAAAQAALEKADADAVDMTAKAQRAADDTSAAAALLLSDTQKQASDILSNAQVMLDDATAKQQAAEDYLAATQETVAGKLNAAAIAQQAAVQAQADAEAEKAAAEKVKNDFLARVDKMSAAIKEF